MARQMLDVVPKLMAGSAQSTLSLRFGDQF